ncbi:helix-turn-helix transcriptional regulator [Sphingomonas oryzagri]
MKATTDRFIGNEATARAGEHAFATTLDESWLTLDQLVRLVPVSPSTIYRKIGQLCFPAPIKFGGRSLWLKSQVMACMDAKRHRIPVDGERLDLELFLLRSVKVSDEILKNSRHFPLITKHIAEDEAVPGGVR